MNRCIIPVVVLLMLVASAFCDDRVGGLWSRTAKSINQSAMPTDIPSPDGKKQLMASWLFDEKADDSFLKLSVRIGGKELTAQIKTGVNPEAMWAPDSTAFFITYSEGGLVGDCHVKVVWIGVTGLSISEPLVPTRKLFAPVCFKPEIPEVVGLAWPHGDSSQLLVALVVPGHSSCAGMGTFRTYQIDSRTGRVVASYSQLESKRRFKGYLASSLLEAEDECARHPIPTRCRPRGMKGSAYK